MAWIIPIPINLTRLNETFCYVKQADLTSTTAVVDGNTLIITNNSVNIASWAYTSQGVMQSYVERDWSDGSVIYNFTLVESQPAIALQTSTNTKILIGGSIPLTITDINGEGLATVRYLFSSSAALPTTWDQANSLSSPWTVVMPDGALGVIYLHVLAEDALGFQTFQSFTLERLAGNEEPGIPGFWIVGIGIAAIGAIGIDIQGKKRKIREL